MSKLIANSFNTLICQNDLQNVEIGRKIPTRNQATHR